MNFFNFSRSDFDYICNEAMLNEEYKRLLEMKIKDYSRIKMADELCISVETLDKMISKLKKKIKKIL